jgi:dihydroorotate dehydrogenase
MVNFIRQGILQTNKLSYQLLRPLLFSRNAQQSHDDVIQAMRIMDANPLLQLGIQQLKRQIYPDRPVQVGGVDLPSPLILAAGFVKGDGFDSEQEALTAIRQGQNIIPGWRTMPNLLGAVEFGSFTRHPRIGNPGTVIWRDVETQSTQNRVGLKNPGAVAAAAFLFEHIDSLPPVFGINIAPTPGVNDNDEVVESMSAFIARGIRPSWFTLNLSCPNTEDDPEGHQTKASAHALSAVTVKYIRDNVNGSIPIWVKVGPCLSDLQYAALMKAFAETGIKAVIATNTHGQPAPNDPSVNAGMGGGKLHRHAVAAASALMHARQQHNYPVDVIGCGGIQDPMSFDRFRRLGVQAGQVWSALVFRGPLAPALILNEEEHHVY